MLSTRSTETRVAGAASLGRQYTQRAGSSCSLRGSARTTNGSRIKVASMRRPAFRAFDLSEVLWAETVALVTRRRNPGQLTCARCCLPSAGGASGFVNLASKSRSASSPACIQRPVCRSRARIPSDKSNSSAASSGNVSSRCGWKRVKKTIQLISERQQH